jgi:hypothetical protein
MGHTGLTLLRVMSPRITAVTAEDRADLVRCEVEAERPARRHAL